MRVRLREPRGPSGPAPRLSFTVRDDVQGLIQFSCQLNAKYSGVISKRSCSTVREMIVFGAVRAHESDVGQEQKRGLENNQSIIVYNIHSVDCAAWRQ